MKKESLRKVSFSIACRQFEPDLSEEEQKQHGEETRERDGYFHQWVTEEAQSPKSGRFYDRTMALVEDAETGRIYKVETDLIKFKD